MLATKVYSRMHDGPGGAGPVAQGDHGTGRRLPAAARHRLHRPLPDPPLRPGHPGRGDDGGPARRRQGRQGPLHRRLLDVGLAVRQDAVTPPTGTAGRGSCPCRTSTTCSTRGRTRDVRPARRPGRRQHPLEPARRRPRRPALGRRTTARARAIPSWTRMAGPLFLDSDQAIVDAVEQIARERGVSWARSRSPGS